MSYSTFDHKGYTLKAIKTFTGREGYGFNANLYKGGKKIGMVRDMADGGCYHYDLPKDDIRVLQDDISDLGEVSVKLGEYSFNEKLSELDTFVSHLLGDIEQDKQLRKLVKKNKIVLIGKELNDDGFPKVWTLDGVLTPQTKSALERLNWWDEVDYIYNERIS
jgi:hypothetical protein